jgi:hypothetical protein
MKWRVKEQYKEVMSKVYSLKDKQDLQTLSQTNQKKEGENPN